MNVFWQMKLSLNCIPVLDDLRKGLDSVHVMASSGIDHIQQHPITITVWSVISELSSALDVFLRELIMLL